jgi:hypothetical protein
VPTKRKQTLTELATEARDFDWSGVKALTDEEVEAAARADPDTVIPTDEELERAVKDRATRLRRAAKPAAE